MSDESVPTIEALRARDLERDNNREQVYESVKPLLQPDAIVYYPGSGPDPIPFNVFGNNVLYGSLNESNYFNMIKRNDLPYGYKHIEIKRDMSEFNAMFADLRNNPLKNDSVDLIILHDIPNFDDAMSSEIERTLKLGGILIYDGYWLSSEQEKAMASLSSKNFNPHNLDTGPHMDGKTFLAASSFGRPLPGYSLGTHISERAYNERIANNLPVRLMYSQLRIFEKVTPKAKEAYGKKVQFPQGLLLSIIKGTIGLLSKKGRETSSSR